MTRSEERLKKWAATWTGYAEAEIEGVEFTRIDGYTNESGTYWPGETEAVVRASRRRVRRQIVQEDITELLREIMEVGA